MTHPCVKSCLKIHANNNSLVNYSSSVYSVFFVDLAQLIIVLAIAKPLSPTLHHLPTTIKHTAPTPTSLWKRTSLSQFGFVALPRQSHFCTQQPLQQVKRHNATKAQEASAPWGEKKPTGLYLWAWYFDRCNLASVILQQVQNMGVRFYLVKVQTCLDGTNFSDRRDILAVFKLRRVQDNR